MFGKLSVSESSLKIESSFIVVIEPSVFANPYAIKVMILGIRLFMCVMQSQIPQLIRVFFFSRLISRTITASTSKKRNKRAAGTVAGAGEIHGAEAEWGIIAVVVADPRACEETGKGRAKGPGRVSITFRVGDLPVTWLVFL